MSMTAGIVAVSFPMSRWLRLPAASISKSRGLRAGTFAVYSFSAGMNASMSGMPILPDASTSMSASGFISINAKGTAAVAASSE